MFDVIKFPLFAVLLIGALLMFSKRLSGWGELHWNYGCDDSALSGEPLARFRWISLRMNRYLLSTKVRVYPEGLWLAPNWPHFTLAPVLIPWSAVHFAGITWGGFGSTLFRVDGCDAAMYFSGWRARKVEEHMRRMQDEEILKVARLNLRQRPFRVPTVF